MNKSGRTILWILVVLFTLAQTACTAPGAPAPTYPAAAPQATETLPPAATLTPRLTPTLTPTIAPAISATLTPSPTATSTYEAWRSTAAAIATAERAASWQAKDLKATEIAQFPPACDDLNKYASSISPDGNWFAASCGYMRDQTLTVQSKDGTKWVVYFQDIISAEKRGGMGALDPESWSPDGQYLFFSIGLGYSGGGDLCFPPNRGRYGLFRLNLSDGSWMPFVSFKDAFPGYEIRFSPTTEYFAITKHGVTVVHLQTGISTQLAANDTVEKLSWSPDGKRLAFSTATCEEWVAISSTVFIWEVETGQVQVLFEKEGVILTPENWVDPLTLRIIAEEYKDRDSLYTLFEYRIDPPGLVSSGTATPRP